MRTSLLDADDARPDLEAPVELLLGEQRGDARVPEERLGLVGVEGLDDLVERREHRQWGVPARPEWNAANSRRVMCRGFGAPIATRRVSGVIPAAREDAQCDRHP